MIKPEMTIFVVINGSLPLSPPHAIGSNFPVYAHIKLSRFLSKGLLKLPKSLIIPF